MECIFWNKDILSYLIFLQVRMHRTSYNRYSQYTEDFFNLQPYQHREVADDSQYTQITVSSKNIKVLENFVEQAEQTN